MNHERCVFQIPHTHSKFYQSPTVSGNGQLAATEREWNKQEHARTVEKSGMEHGQEYKNHCAHL